MSCSSGYNLHGILEVNVDNHFNLVRVTSKSLQDGSCRLEKLTQLGLFCLVNC
jgi:hypothetical protein